MLVCDFCCSGETVAWSYPCPDFGMVVKVGEWDVLNTSHGGWAACQKCHELIEADKRDELVERNVEMFFTNEGYDINRIPPHHIVAMRVPVKELHDAFFKNRQGPCCAV